MKKIFILVGSILFVLSLIRTTFATMYGGITSSKMMSTRTAQVQDLETETEAINVGNEICPVSGEKIDEKTKVTYEYKSKIYNLCCPGCKSEFEANPEKYIGEKSEEEKETYEHKHMMH